MMAVLAVATLTAAAGFAACGSDAGPNAAGPDATGPASEPGAAEVSTGDAPTQGEPTQGEPTQGEPAARCDTNLNVAAYYDEADTAGVDVNTGFAHQHDEPGHGDPQVDEGHQEMGEVESVGLMLEALSMNDAEYDAWLAEVAAPRDPDAPDDTGRGGHLGPHPWSALTERALCERLASEIERSRAIALRYPKGADAKAAGWVPVTPYVPGIAAHFMRFDYVDGTFDIDEPEMLLYDGTGDDANVLGLSYYVRLPGDAEPTDGFSGDNDHYHRHIGLCVKGTMVIGDSTTSKEDCAAMGGTKADGSDGWMNHVWSVPGCESPWGLFSGINPVLDSALGAHAGEGSPCSTSESRHRYDLHPGMPG
jgi:hypothetical protein